MQAELYEIVPCLQGRLATMPRPRGGEWLEGELASLKSRGVSDLVSLLTPAEEVELGLQSEELFCSRHRIRFHRHPVPDRGVPRHPHFDHFIDALWAHLIQPGFIAIHCRAGIGRSTIAAAALLTRTGLSATEALTLISRARGFDVPDTGEQLDFIYGFDERAD